MQYSQRLHGSGEWFLQRDSFEKWRDAYSSKLLWLRGRPGAGKSFLAGNVVNYLRHQGYDCCSFFFASGDSQKGTINAFLRSMAYQMAVRHPEIHSTIEDVLRKKDITVDEGDFNAVWRQIYLGNGILKVKLDRQQYWVIDAMDECRGSSEIMNLLVKAQESWPLCVLITSREPFKPSMTHRGEVLTDTMSDEDSNGDIALFLQTNLDVLPASTPETRQEMADKILLSSRGCFLWANLMVKELRQVHTAAETKMVLASNPSDMNELYLKILDDMSRVRFGKDLAKAILVWMTCSFRPLTKHELQAAIQLDIKDTIDDIERSVISCCGNLVFVDRRGRFQLIHTTARDFLLDSALQSEFAVDRTAGHTRMALACIEYLFDHDMRSSSKTNSFEDSPFLGYASEYLFQHLVLVKSSNDEIFKQLAKFFASSSLMTWIEYMAANSDLHKVYQAGKTILNLLRRRSQHKPNVGHLQNDISRLEVWGNDLLHLVTKFSHRMRLAPTAIRHLIPPFCPPESIIRKQFCLQNRGLNVTGTSGMTWDECLTTIAWKKATKPLSTAAGIGFFALGFNTGEIVMYDDTIFQEVKVFEHREPVWLLQFGETGKYLVSSSARSILVWNLETWTQLFKFPLKTLPIALSLVEQDTLLIVATKRNEVMRFDLLAGRLRDEPVNWTRDFEESGEGPALHLRQPMMADYSPHQNLLAIIYRGEDILLWDTENDRIHDIYEKDTGSRSNGSLKIADGSTTVRSLAFSSAQGTYLLATTYSDGDLIVYNTWTGDIQKILPGGNLMSLASSPDGRTLVGAGTMGDVLLFDFEILRYLYRVSIANNTMMSNFISFTTDSQRIIDIRQTQCRVWQPTVLLRQDGEEDNSDTVSISTGVKEVDYQVTESLIITALCCVKPPGPGASIVFAGKEDGSVHVYDISGEPLGTQLFVQSAMCAVVEIHFDVWSGLLTCRDRSSKVTCRKLNRIQRSRWNIGETLLDKSCDLTQITQVLGSGKNSACLVSAEDYDTLWPLSRDTGCASLAQIEGHKTCRWLTHPARSDCLILVKSSAVELRSWTNLAVLSTVAISTLSAAFTSIDRVIPLNHPHYFATFAVDQSGTKLSQGRFQVWDFSCLESDVKPLKPSLSLDSLSTSVEAIIGVYSERLVYVDASYWVSSIDISEPLEVPVRHFFIPNDWLSIIRELVLDVAKGGEIIFVRQSDLAVIKRGLEVTDSGASFNPRRKSTMALPLRSAQRTPVRPGPSTLPGRDLRTT